MFTVSDSKSLIRDKDFFLISDSSNTPNFYSSDQVHFAGNKVVGDGPNCRAITVTLQGRSDSSADRELLREMTKVN